MMWGSQDSRTTPTHMPNLPNLRHLTIDTHMSTPVIGLAIVMPQIWQIIFSARMPPSFQLTSLFLRFSDKLVLSRDLVKDILNAHGSTLKSLYFVNCELDFDGLKSVAVRCQQLERLAVKIPIKDVVSASQTVAS